MTGTKSVPDGDNQDRIHANIPPTPIKKSWQNALGVKMPEHRGPTARTGKTFDG
jgi:hypothetical protein